MQRTTRWLVLVFVGLLSGVVVWAQGGSAGLPEEVVNYFSWQRANAQKSFEESAHPVAKDIYLNEIAAQTVNDGSFPHAEGSIFVKETVDPITLQISVITAMRKVANFNPDNGDWQYGMFERDDEGQLMGGWMSVENAAMCIGCHQDAAETDYTFLTYLNQE